MNITDFETECGLGLCATGEIDGEEFILSHEMRDVYAVKGTVDLIVHECLNIPTIGYRYMVIQSMLKLEMESSIRDEKTRLCLWRDYGISQDMTAVEADMAFSLCLSLAQLKLKEVEA